MNVLNREIIEIKIPRLIKNHKVNIEIAGSLGIAVSILSAAFYKYIFVPRIEEVKSSFTRSMEKDEKIRQQLTILRDRSDANRATLIRVHNGQYYAGRQHIWKVSTFLQNTKEGVTSTKHWFRNTLALDFLESFPGTIENGFCELVKDSKVENPFRFHLFNHGIDTIHVYPIFGPKGKELLAFIMLDWDEPHSERKDIDKYLYLLASLLITQQENPFIRLMDNFIQ